ncbi:MAG: hypothetical protein ACI8W7_003445 [Gammaproteobacteria bacterium]|jgi:hypothetical protein
MSTISPGLVSTIIPVFNRVAMLNDAVQSVLGQSYRPIEVIIVDNASTDDTPREAARLAQLNPTQVRLAHCTTRGAGAAREVGRRQARGEFIQYLDSDDLLMPEKFHWQVAALRAAPQCAIAYGITRYRGRGGTILHEQWKRTGEQIEHLFPSILLGRWWGTSTPLYRREALDRCGAWLNIANEEDWEYDCRLAAMGVRLSYVAELVSEERDHGGARLSRGGSTEPAKLDARAQAHALILRHALQAGISRASPQMQHFTRALFLLARQCGAAGLTAASKELFSLSRDSAHGQARRAMDYRIYALLAGLVGWRAAGRLSTLRDHWRTRASAADDLD